MQHFRKHKARSQEPWPVKILVSHISMYVISYFICHMHAFIFSWRLFSIGGLWEWLKGLQNIFISKTTLTHGYHFKIPNGELSTKCGLFSKQVANSLSLLLVELTGHLREYQHFIKGVHRQKKSCFYGHFLYGGAQPHSIAFGGVFTNFTDAIFGWK